MKYILPAILLFPLALNGMESGTETSYKELSVFVRLSALDIEINDIEFTAYGPRFVGNITPDQDTQELRRFYTESGARLYTNETDNITLRADSYTADVSLSSTNLQNNCQEVVVNYTISKPLLCIFSKTVASGTGKAPITNTVELKPIVNIFDDNNFDAVWINVWATWKTHQNIQ